MAKIQTLFGSLDDLEKQKAEAEARKGTLFGRMREAVTRTRENLSERIEDIIPANREIDQYTLDELEVILVSADLGTDTVQQILANLRERVTRKQVENFEELKRLLKEEILALLNVVSQHPAKQVEGPEVILVVGVNGTGKTTTLGNLAAHLRAPAKSVLRAPGDTFRAPAIAPPEL